MTIVPPVALLIIGRGRGARMSPVSMAQRTSNPLRHVDQRWAENEPNRPVSRIVPVDVPDATHEFKINLTESNIDFKRISSLFIEIGRAHV